MIGAIVSVPSITSGNPLIAEVVKVSKIRAFFGMSSVLLNVYSQGMMSTGWRWSCSWYHPHEITGY
jgi:hypothetical protein